MSSAYGRLATIRDYWVPRDLNARIEVRVTDLDEVLRELVRVITLSADQNAANIKLLGALDMIRETLKGGAVDDLLYIINTAVAQAKGEQTYNAHEINTKIRERPANAHDKAYSEVDLADAYQKGWNDAMLRSSLGPHGIKEGA